MRVVTLLMLTLTLSACVVAPSYQQFSAGQTVVRAGVTFQLPKERSWSALVLSTYQTMLGANEKPDFETIMILVSSYPLPELSSPEAHLEYIKDTRKKTDPDTGRFKVIKNNEEIYSARAETCVKFESTVSDHASSAVRAGGFTVIDTYGMYCVHPNSPRTGVYVELSRKAPPESKSLTFKDMGERLLQSVQFIDYKI